MSFAQAVKKELMSLEIERSSIYELAAIVKMNGNLIISHDGVAICIQTENASIARHIYALVKHFFSQSCKISVINNYSFNKRLYKLMITENVLDILDKLEISFTEDKDLEDYTVLKSANNRKAYIRGAFLSSGSINNPQTAKYHLEFKDKDENHAQMLSELLNTFALNSKVIVRNNLYVVYIKEAEKIVETLAYINATQSLLFYENIRITRDVRNQTNRLENCEQANYEKSYNAAKRQLENIKVIENSVGLNVLEEKYLVLVNYRKQYPEYSLAELASVMSEELNEKYSKSKLNHWFRKIAQIANNIKKNT